MTPLAEELAQSELFRDAPESVLQMVLQHAAPLELQPGELLLFPHRPTSTSTCCFPENLECISTRWIRPRSANYRRNLKPLGKRRLPKPDQGAFGHSCAPWTN